MNTTKKFKTAFEVVKDKNLNGKIYLITGAYSGLGAATTEALLSAGATVIIAGRSRKSQDDFVNQLNLKLRNLNPNQIDASQTLDLGNLSSVKSFAKNILNKYKTLDCIINNAGIMNTPFGKTTDGFEIQMGTNVIGHFLLNKILIYITQRQVWLSSSGHCLVGDWPGEHDVVNAPRIDIDAITQVDEKTYDGWKRYQQSKLGDILLAKQFKEEYPNLLTCAVHPGVVQTNLSRHMSIWPLLRHILRVALGKAKKPLKPIQGATTQTYCATADSNELVNGAYYDECQVSIEANAAKNVEDAKKLFDYCNQVTLEFQ